MEAIEKLAESIATSGTGYAAVINGALDVTTISDSRRLAAMKGMIVAGIPATLVSLLSCPNPDCDCVEKTLAENFPGSRIVAVKVEVTG